MLRSRPFRAAGAFILVTVLAGCEVRPPAGQPMAPPSPSSPEPLPSPEPTAEPSPEPLRFDLDYAAERLLCAVGPQPVYALPPAFGHASNAGVEPGGFPAPGGFGKVGDTESACDAVRLVARLPGHHPAYRGDGWYAFDWARARIGRASPLVGWVDLSDACIAFEGEVPALCDLAFPQGNLVARAARRAFLKLPEISPGGGAGSGSDLAFLRLTPAFEEGETCVENYTPIPGLLNTYPAAHVVRVRNEGTGPTPARIQVRANAFLGPEFGSFDGTITFTFLRGLEPGEEALLLYAVAGPVVLDPNDRIDETNEANNAVEAPGGPSFVCE